MYSSHKDFLKYNPTCEQWVHKDLQRIYRYLSRENIQEAGLVKLNNYHCITIGMYCLEYFHEYQRDQDWQLLHDYAKKITNPQNMLKKYGVTIGRLFFNYQYLFGSFGSSYDYFKKAYFTHNSTKFIIKSLIAFRYTIGSDTKPTIEEYVNTDYLVLDKAIKLFGDIFLNLPARGLGDTAEKTKSNSKPK